MNKEQPMIEIFLDEEYLSLFDFYIYGMPRTGTAWAANFFSYGKESICLHEPEMKFNHNAIREIKKEHKKIGISSCGLSNENEFDYSNSKGIILKRPIDDIRLSLKACENFKALSEIPIFKSLQKKHHDFVDKHIEFFPTNLKYLIEDVAICKKVWEFIFNGEITWDAVWHFQCSLMNVQLQIN